ncbi:MAG: AMP-binding protein [Pseudanabaenaceae cyanobacterium SKYGB_i_bin29]|nr:AMP-binding protein [Pseudanabaenaceae cyanobacterium SKYG29]MDW8421153.1 AMP-binding protein [Pseudanabaenaceae cyanobacterium SKYGB_i_bin29]
MKRPIDHSQAQNLWQVLQKVATVYPDIPALVNHHPPYPVQMTYREMVAEIRRFGAGLRQLGVKAGAHVALFADNSPRWFIADQGVLAIGAVDVTRSSQADKQELLFILQNSDSVALIVEDLKTLRKLQPQLDDYHLSPIILLSDEEGYSNYKTVIEMGKEGDLGDEQPDRSSLATLIYTSGTSGYPKGVMLTHGNFLYEITAALDVVHPQPGYRVLSILPTWHSYERTFEYFILSQGCTQIYTSIRTFKEDIKKHKPHYMVAVPRLWESVYEGIQKNLKTNKKRRLIEWFLAVSHKYIYAQRTRDGLNLRNLNPSVIDRVLATITSFVLLPVHLLADRLVYRKIREATGGEVRFFVSGGGSIADHLEDFFEVIGIEILGGYGLTETSPITHVRRKHRNLRGADGQPLPQTETRIVDPETKKDLPFYQQGLILIRGPQVMQGYYKNPEATQKVIDAEGWFNTGDLGWMTPQGDLVITGRAKDTIVLTNGENIEPQPIEDACLRSPYIDQIMLVGQDQKHLGALIVPNFDRLAQDGYIPADRQPQELIEHMRNDTRIIDLFRTELNREVKNRPGYRPDDRIVVFHLLAEPFSIEQGTMTQTLKIKRNVVMEKYKDVIDRMYAS